MAHRTTEHFTVGDSYHLTAVPVALSSNAWHQTTLSFFLVPCTTGVWLLEQAVWEHGSSV